MSDRSLLDNVRGSLARQNDEPSPPLPEPPQVHSGVDSGAHGFKPVIVFLIFVIVTLAFFITSVVSHGFLHASSLILLIFLSGFVGMLVRQLHENYKYRSFSREPLEVGYLEEDSPAYV